MTSKHNGKKNIRTTKKLTGGVNDNAELLCDLTTTEYVSEVKWTQGDNGQVFDDYREIFIKMMLQPTENTVTGFRISIEKDLPGWNGKYGGVNALPMNFPKTTEKTSLCFVHLRKTINGIEQTIRNSFNNGSVSMFQTTQNDTIIVKNFKSSDINNPDQLPDISFPKHFECIYIGSYVANMPPNCRFMVYGIK